VESCVTAVRARFRNVPVGISTGEWIVPDPLLRLKMTREWRVNPSFASVNFQEAGANVLAQSLLNRGVGVEAGLSNREAADVFINNGIASQVLRVLIEPQEQNLEAALETGCDIKEELARARLDLPIVLHGTENNVWELLDEAIRSGCNIRIGFEDTLKLPNGETAPSNGALVRYAQLRVASLRPHNLEVCIPHSRATPRSSENGSRSPASP
jgi:uncharacterized protein (DUF849 family)